VSAAYWEESVALAFDAIGQYEVYAALTREQQKQIGESLAGSYENHGLSHYTPSGSDRLASMEREWRQRLEEERDRTEAARRGAEKAVRSVLGLHRDANISVTDGGEVYRHGGRTERLA